MWPPNSPRRRPDGGYGSCPHDGTDPNPWWGTTLVALGETALALRLRSVLQHQAKPPRLASSPSPGVLQFQIGHSSPWAESSTPSVLRSLLQALRQPGRKYFVKRSSSVGKAMGEGKEKEVKEAGKQWHGNGMIITWVHSVQCIPKLPSLLG